MAVCVCGTDFFCVFQTACHGLDRQENGISGYMV